MKENLWRHKFTVYFLVILAIIFFHYTKILWPIERLTFFVLSPVNGVVYNLTNSLTEGLVSLEGRRELYYTHEAWREKIDKLEQQIVELKTFIEENKMVVEQNKYLAARGFKFVAGRVVGVAPGGNPNLLVLNQGTSDGIKVGMVATAGQGRVIGKIIKTEANSAYLLLLIDNSCQLSAAVAGRSEIVGLAKGRHNLSLSLEYILKSADLKTGDLIMTSGAESEIPAGLVIGEVAEINEEVNSLFKDANLVTVANFKNIKIVNVIIK